MAAKVQTAFGCAMPPATRHAITVQFSNWGIVERFANRDPELIKSLTSVYPRMIPHKDVKELTGKILAFTKAEGKTCLLFSSLEAANACKAFATSPKRGENVTPAEDIQIRIFDIDVRLFAIFYPVTRAPFINAYWKDAGTGICSRLAEESLKRLDLLREASPDDPPPKVEESSAQGIIRERIAGLLERAPIGSPRTKKVSQDDVYLFQTGMAAIYRVHQYLLNQYHSPTVLFGMAFHSTLDIFNEVGSSFKHFGLGTDSDLDALETYLESEAQSNRGPQAIWTEIPANPILWTSDLSRLRALADKYHTLLIVDDTVGSFCNVDVLPYADAIITSLTKSFSGYADVMGASAVLNPNSARYDELKSLFTKVYQNDYYNLDAEVMERNSRDYLTRSAILNRNAAHLVSYLTTLSHSPTSSIARVYYPTTSPSLPSYNLCKRPTTPEFTPGYGGLFTVEFKSVEATIAFFDKLDVHKGPHLGAHLTIALPYVRALYSRELEWAGERGLRVEQVRIAVGLEDAGELEGRFGEAVEEADKAWRKGGDGKVDGVEKGNI